MQKKNCAKIAAFIKISNTNYEVGKMYIKKCAKNEHVHNAQEKFIMSNKLGRIDLNENSSNE